MSFSYDRFHWRLFTILVRLFGLGMLVVGLAFLVVGPRLGALFALPVSLLILRARPYRPDQGDVERFVDPFGARGNSRGKRRWWTGDDIG
jgi:hypothetical protein